MKRVVFKWQVPTMGTLEPIALELPADAEFIAAGLDLNSVPCVWTLHSPHPQAPTRTRYVVAVPTGREFEAERLSYIGTAVLEEHYEVLADSQLVAHLFEVHYS